MGYDYTKSHLYLSTADGVVYDLQLRPSITIIHGDSATGKTRLCSLISAMQKIDNTALGVDDLRNIFVVSDEKSLKEAMTCKSKLIMIDYADDILHIHSAEVEHINQDTSNHYLIFARRVLGFSVTPNYVGDFIREDKTVTIKYMADIKGWF